MIQKLEITGVHMEVDKKLHDYVAKKIGRLDLYMPLHARKSAHSKVKLKESKAKDKKVCTCEVILYLPHETIAIKESTINMFAAVDVVEAKLKNQLKKYKEKHTSERLHRRLLTRIKHRVRR